MYDPYTGLEEEPQEEGWNLYTPPPVLENPFLNRPIFPSFAPAAPLADFAPVPQPVIVPEPAPVAPAEEALPEGFVVEKLGEEQPTEYEPLPEGFELEKMGEEPPPPAQDYEDLPEGFVVEKMGAEQAAGPGLNEFWERIKRGTRTGLEDVQAGFRQQIAEVFRGQRNPYVEKTTAEAQGDVPRLEAEIKAAEDRIAGVETKEEVTEEEARALREESPRISALHTQLEQARRAAKGDVTETFRGTLSRAAEDIAIGDRDRQEEIKKEYEGKISSANDQRFWMQVADSVGASLPTTGSAMLNPLFGLSLMYSQTYEQSRQDFLEKGGDVEKAHEYATKQAALQTPFELVGDVAFAKIAKGALSRLVKDGTPQSFTNWIKERAVEFGKATLGEVTVTTPAQTLIEQGLGEQYGVRALKTAEEKWDQVIEASKIAAGQSLLMGGAPVTVEAAGRGVTGGFAVPAEVSAAPGAPAAPPAAALPPGVTIVPAISPEVPGAVPPPPPEVRLAEVDQELATAPPEERAKQLQAEKLALETDIATAKTVVATEQHVQNLEVANAPESAKALATATAEDLAAQKVGVDEMIEELAPAGVFAEEAAVPGAVPVPAAPPPAVEPTGEERFAPPAARAPTLAETVPAMPTEAGAVSVKMPAVTPEGLVPVPAVAEEAVIQPGIKGQEAVIARPSQQLAQHLGGLTVDVEAVAPTGERVLVKQDATQALMDLKKDKTAFQLLIDCLS